MKTDRGTTIDVASCFRVMHDNEEISIMTRDEDDRKEVALMRLTPSAARKLALRLTDCATQIERRLEDWRSPR